MTVLYSHDLAALEARCYITWIERFSLNKDQKSSYATIVKRHVCNKEQENSDILYKRIESEAEINSMSEIYSKIIEFVEENNDVYTKRWLQMRLKIKYWELVMFTEVSGKPNIVCFKYMTEFVVNDKWFSERGKKYSNDETERIIVTATMLTNKHVITL